jgi:hypothetical protein
MYYTLFISLQVLSNFNAYFVLPDTKCSSCVSMGRNVDKCLPYSGCAAPSSHSAHDSYHEQYYTLARYMEKTTLR